MDLTANGVSTFEHEMQHQFTTGQRVEVRFPTYHKGVSSIASGQILRADAMQIKGIAVPSYMIMLDGETIQSLWRESDIVSSTQQVAS